MLLTGLFFFVLSLICGVLFKLLLFSSGYATPEDYDMVNASPHPLHFDYAHFLFGTISIAIFGLLHLLFAVAPHGGLWDLRWGRENSNAWLIVMAVLVIVGTLRAMWVLYKAVNRISRSWLEQAGAVIMDVSE